MSSINYDRTLGLPVQRETVEVRADPVYVDTQGATVAVNVPRDWIDRLPVIGRQVLPLINLEPGVAQNGQAFTSINGLRPSFAVVTLDGITVQDNYIRANGLDFLPNHLRSDQIGEFTIVSQNGGAPLRGGASFVSFTTPTGGSTWHGAGYWHNRNSALTPNDWFNNKAGTPKPSLNRNQAGLSVGGPLVEDRLFLYAKYEAERRTAEQGVNRLVLTQAARNGVFTYQDLDGNAQTLDLLRATGNSFDPAVERLLDQVPPPESINSFDVGDSSPSFLRNTAGYRFNVENNLDRDSVLLRVDAAAGPGHWLSTSYQFVRDDPDRPDLGTGLDRRPPIHERSRVHLLSAAWRFAPSARFSGEVRGGFNRNPTEFRTTEGLDGRLFDGFAFSNPRVNFEPEGRKTNIFSVGANFTHHRGKHGLAFGGQIQSTSARIFSRQGLQPRFQIGVSLANPLALAPEMFFGGVTSEDFGDAQNLLASLAGFVASGAQTFNVRSATSGFVSVAPFERRFFLKQSSAYLQDRWNITGRLVLSFGLRWEYWGRFDERDGLLLGPRLDSAGIGETLLSNAVIDFLGGFHGRPVYRPDRNNFAPSVSLAADPFGDGRTAFRAGYAISYVNDETLFAGDTATSVNEGLRTTVRLHNLAAAISADLPAFEPPGFRIPRTTRDGLDSNPVAVISAIDPNLRSPYVQQWNAGVQRKIGSTTLLDLRYVGNHASKLLRGVDLNQFDIFTNGFLDDFLRARSNGFLALPVRGEFDPRFDPTLSGSRPLDVIPRLGLEGLLV